MMMSLERASLNSGERSLKEAKSNVGKTRSARETYDDRVAIDDGHKKSV